MIENNVINVNGNKKKNALTKHGNLFAQSAVLISD